MENNHQPEQSENIVTTLKFFLIIALVVFGGWLYLGQTVFAAGLIIHSGAELRLNASTLDMNCLGITIESEGLLDLGSGAVEECWDLTISGTGQLIGGTTFFQYCDDDSDGLPDSLEEDMCTNSLDDDYDDDGIIDGAEDANHNGVVDSGETSPCLADTDGDGLQDGTEMGLSISDIGIGTDEAVFIADADPSTTTNPLDDDSDNDGMLDGDEDKNHNGALNSGETDPNVDDFPWEIFYPAFIKKRP